MSTLHEFKKLAGLAPKYEELALPKHRHPMVGRLRKVGAKQSLIEAVSSEPTQRALDRMADAKKRGGLEGMIRDTAQRAKVTKDPDKLAGILSAIEATIVSDEEDMTPEQVHALRAIQAHAKGAGASSGPTRKHVGNGGGRAHSDGSPDPILPAGSIDVATGKNEYWDDGVGEVWSDGGKLFVVYTSGTKPLHAVGDRQDFQHDQTGKMLRRGATMVGWFTLDPNGEMGGKVPTKGKLPVATYK